MKHVAIIGAGWAGLAAAVRATQAGHQVTVFEAAAQVGGRARNLSITDDKGHAWALDNGQHILIGAYTSTLALMRQVGVDPDKVLLRMPLTLCTPDGMGMQLPDWPAPADLVAGVLRARGWGWRDKAALLLRASRWQRQNFQCTPDISVEALCRGLPTAVMQLLIEPLCVSALNTPCERASAQVFLRVLHDAMFEVKDGSRLLLPLLPLGDLFAEPAVAWLRAHGASVLTSTRVRQVQPAAASLAAAATHGSQWLIDGAPYDQVMLACSANEAVRLVRQTASLLPSMATQAPLLAWCDTASALKFEAITTVFLQTEASEKNRATALEPAAASTARHQASAARSTRVLALPMMALHSKASAPAQFVFDRGQLGGPDGLLAFVVSASQGDRDTLTAQVLAQASQQLGLHDMKVLQTVVEKRATFACTPGLQRPAQHVVPGLMACGDYVQSPYPATLEGAVRSGESAAKVL